MAAHVFSDPLVAADLWDVAPVFDPGVAAGGVAAVAGASPVLEDRVLTFLELAEGMVDRDAFGTVKAPQAVALMCAHLLYLDATDNVSPTASTATDVTAVAVGPVSKSFAARAPNATSAFDDVLGDTPWGRRFLTLRSTLMMRAVF